MGYLYMVLTVLLTVYGQMVLKWRMNLMGPLPSSPMPVCGYLFSALMDPFVLSTFGAAFVASLTYMAALTKFDITVAYPFMSLGFVLVVGLGALLVGEALTVGKIAGTLLIVAGVFLVAR